MLDLRSFRHPSRHRSAATRTSGRRLGLLIAGAACSPAVATDYTWNGLGSDNNWSSAANWLGGAAPANDTSTQLFFAGSTRLLPSADAPWSIGGLTFNSDAGAFTLGGSTLTLASGVSVTNNATTTQTIATSGIVLSEASTWNAASGGLTVSSVISGSGSLTKTGTGTLTLSGANTYSGNTLFNGGILSITNNSALGTGDLVFDGGTLSTTTGMVTTRNTTIDSGGANFALSNGFYTLNGNVTGTGGLTKTGTSILTLNGAHTYTGATVISGGTLKIADNGGTASTFASSSVNISSGARMIFNNSQTYAGAITGAGYIEREFSGTTTLTGAASHTGGTNVILGTLQIGNGGTSGSLDGNVALSAGGTLAFNRSDAASFGGVISGDGYVTKAGAGTLTLSGTNTYSRGTTISGGLVNFANLDNFGSGAITLNGGGLQWADGNTADVSSRLGAFGANGATFDTNGNNVTLASALSGGALTKTGDGTLTLAGGSSFGNTEITRGTLSIASADSLGSGLLIFDGGTLQTTATFTLNHGMPFAGTFDVVNDTTLTLENSIGGSSNLTKSGGGTLVLQSGNSYQGGTDLTGGTLSISSDSQLGDSSGQLRFSGGSLHTTADLTLNRSLLGDVAIEVDAGTTATVPTSFGDGGSGLVKSGAGALLLTGTNDFSTVSLNEGTLKLGSSGALGSSGLISFAFGTLQYSAANTVDYSSRFTSDGDQFINIDTNGQAITFATALGSGSRTDFAKLGAGSLTLSGKNTFSYLYVKDGSLTIQDGASISNYVTSIGSTAVSGPAAPPAVVNVSGPDASWEIEHTLSVGRVTTSSYYIGDSGGTLNISQGASVSANIVNLGSVGTIVPDGFAVTALINVTGAGSSLSVNNNLTMAVGGTDATLAISDGASVSMSSLWMGHSTFTGGSQGSATVTISGAGSSLTTQYLRAGGRSGPVSISVSDGAQLISGAADQSASIANADPFQPGASVVSISGAGSQWTVNAGGIAVGHSHSFGVNGAEGELTVADHGKVTVQGENNTIQLSSSRSTTSKGTLNIGAAASAPAASAGFVSAAAITGGLGTGIVQFNTTGTALAPTYFTADGTATGTATPITGRVSIVNTAGTTVLKGENSYTGGNTINGGTLVGDASSIKGDIANHSAVIFNQATDGSHTGVISGAGSFTKTGAGVLSVGGVNTYTGATTISGGTLLLTGIQTHLADSPPVAVLDATSGVVTNSGAVTSWADLSGSGNHATAGAGSVTLGTLGGGRAALVFDGSSSLANPLSSSGADYTIVALFEAASIGDNRSILGSSQGNALQFRINTSGQLQFLAQSIAELGTTSATVSAGDTYLVTGTSTSGEQAFYFDTALSGSIGSGDYTFDPGATVLIGANANGDEYFNGKISLLLIYDSVLTPDEMFAVQTAALLALNTNTTYASPVDSFTPGSLPTATAVNITASGAALDLNGYTQTIGSLAGVAGSNVYLGSGRLTAGGDNTSTTFAGVISGNGGSLVKTGGGVFTLTGLNTYTGGTFVNAGTLRVNGSLANTAVTVASGATLGGSGTIGGPATFSSGAHLAPGNSPGTITFTGGLALEGGMFLDFELGTTSDLILVTGGTLSGPTSGTITVNLSNSGGFTAGTYTLIDATGATLGSIGATSFDLGVTIAGYTYTFAQNGDLFQLTATAVPEPATTAALSGLAIVGFAIFRRRRAKP